MISVASVELDIRPTITARGHSARSLSDNPRRLWFEVRKIRAFVRPGTAHVTRFEFEASEIIDDSTIGDRNWIIESDDRILNEVKLAARRVVATAAQRAETGAR